MKQLITIILLLLSFCVYSQTTEVMIHAQAGYIVSKDTGTIITLKCPDNEDLKTPCYFTFYLPSGIYYYVAKMGKDVAEILIANNLVILMKINEDSNFMILRE